METQAGGGLLLSGTAWELLESRCIGSRDRHRQSRGPCWFDRTLLGLEVSPKNQGTASLVGRAVGSGFRAALDATFRAERRPHGPLHLLLDDLPVAVLISGYAALYSGKMQIERKHLDAGLLKADICSGWRLDATMLVTLKNEGHLPVSLGPPAGALDETDDELAWHASPQLASGAMRRRRLIDVVSGDPIEVFAMFRVHAPRPRRRRSRAPRVLADCRARPFGHRLRPVRRPPARAGRGPNAPWQQTALAGSMASLWERSRLSSAEICVALRLVPI